MQAQLSISAVGRGFAVFLVAGTIAAGAGLASASTPPNSFADESSIDQVVGAPAAWAQGADGHGVDVALVDTGVTPVQGLNGPNKLIYGPDISFDSQLPGASYLDGYGHGTAMAGIIAGNDGTAGGYQGVAPQARIVSVKVGASTGAADVSQIIAGIDWVVAHAHDNGMNIRVLNLSLGTDSTQAYTSDPLAHAAEVAWRHGIVVVVSAGNDLVNGANTVADPATDPYLIAVGADETQGTLTPGDDTVASFSQRGTGVRHPDLVAPGTYVYGLLSPNSTLAQQNPNAIFGGRFLRGSGTSQSAAIVSGAAADVISARPSLTPDQVKAVLTSTAVPINANKNYSGSGLVQVGQAVSAPVPAYSTQSYPVGSGNGSLEAARGSSHVSLNGQTLTGEQDIFGAPWVGSTMGQAEEKVAAWSGGMFNGSQWSGSQWSSGGWDGSQWSGSQWSGSQWSGSQWSGSQWSGSQWSGSQWSGSQWSGSQWSGSQWGGSQWSSAMWDGAQWG